MSFGLDRQNYEDVATFAYFSGRVQYIQRAIRTAIDRRRRQAHLIMRRLLPVELAERVLS